MNTLSNVEPQGGGAEPLSTGFASDVLPEVHSPSAADSHTGVSTNYAPKVAPRWKVPCWFVLRVTYGRIDKAVEDLKAKNIPTYVPMQYVERIVLGKKKRVKQPLFPNLIFARMTRIESHSIVKSPAPTATYIRYYLDKTEKPESKTGLCPPVILSEDVMQHIVRATISSNPHVMTLPVSRCHFKSNDQVRVKEGEFKGFVGRVIRVAGQQRVALEIKSICYLATAFVPSAFLEKVEEDSGNGREEQKDVEESVV